jgi:glycosyltransferase involved in cell wall biosynthesis
MFVSSPEWFTLRERIYMRGIPLSGRRANLIFTSSESEANRLKRVMPFLADRIVPVGLSQSPTFLAAPERPPALRLPRSFYLTVGRLNVRKNIGPLIHALFTNQLISPDFPLVVVGQPNGAQEESSPTVLEAARTQSVVFTGYVSDGELKALYRACTAFIFPSKDEGFGLPVLEARSQGAPLILSDIAPFRELGTEADIFFNPCDPQSIAGAVRRFRERNNRSPMHPLTTAESEWPEIISRMRREILDHLGVMRD